MAKKYLKFTGHKSGCHKTFTDFGFHWVAGDVQQVEAELADEAEKTFPDLFVVTDKQGQEPKGEPLTDPDKKKLDEEETNNKMLDDKKNKGK